MTMESAESFEQHMAQVIWDNRWKAPSAFDQWLEDHMCAEGAAVFAREHCVFADHFPRWFGHMVGNCPHLGARQYMIDNMYVEEVKDPTIATGHYESMVDFAVALGDERDFIISYKGTIYTRLALAYWDRASRAWPWLEAFAAVAGLEAARGPAVAKLGPIAKLGRQAWAPLGLSEAAMAHWTAGEEADFPEGGHGDMTLKILAEHADTEDAQARVLGILEESMQVRWYHFDQIGRDALAASEGAGAA
ncbi:MAG: iron-containing redox enzyme family protein [Proteobacteria bacterium]|nr:iron-containing redox enzyme family protein [Pseudomonadota bacterium]